MSTGLPANGGAVRAARTLELLRDRGHIRDGSALTVGQLCTATYIDHVIAVYDKWQRGKATDDEYTDVVLSALARVRIEQGL